LIPPSIIKGFAYLPRQTESDHGTIKDYEFYVSNDGKDFGSPVKKSTFEPGKEEKIEIFAPMKCRFIKLKALSEINGLP
jgi:beta-galactosidase